MRHAIAWFVFTAAVLATACTEQRESPTSPFATKPVNAPAVATLSKLEVAPSVLGGQTARATGHPERGGARRRCGYFAEQQWHGSHSALISDDSRRRDD